MLVSACQTTDSWKSHRSAVSAPYGCTRSACPRGSRVSSSCSMAFRQPQTAPLSPAAPFSETKRLAGDEPAAPTDDRDECDEALPISTRAEAAPRTWLLQRLGPRHVRKVLVRPRDWVGERVSE